MFQESSLKDPVINAAGKHCEVCWKRSDTSQYVFVAETKYLIYLSSPLIVHHDEVARKVIAQDGTEIIYDYLNANIAYVMHPLFVPHILCSAACASKLSRASIMINNIALNGIWKLDCKNKSMPLYDVTVLSPLALNYKVEHCKHCGRAFPNASRTFMGLRIRDVKIIPTEHGANLSQVQGYTVGHSDANEVHIKGKAWLFKVDNKMEVLGAYCSDECMFYEACERNIVIYTQNIVLKGFHTMMTPYIEEANKGLGFSYPYRPKTLLPL